jgi:hypothetical protein
MKPHEREFVERLCKALGIPTSDGPLVDIGFFEVCWDGKAMRFGDADICGALHDIAHWLVAHPKRRSEADFGLKTYVPEEALASALGIALHACLDRKGAQAHADLHSWIYRDRYGDNSYRYVSRCSPWTKLKNNSKRAASALAAVAAAGLEIPWDLDLRKL